MPFDLKWIFQLHEPTPQQVPKYNAIRTRAADLCEVIVNNTPPGADQNYAINLVRQAVMTANSAIALEGRLTTVSEHEKTQRATAGSAT